MIKIFSFSKDLILNQIIQDNFRMVSQPSEANTIVLDSHLSEQEKQQVLANFKHYRVLISIDKEPSGLFSKNIPDNLYYLSHPIYHQDVVKTVKTSYFNELAKSRIFYVNDFAIDIFAHMVACGQQLFKITQLETKLIKYLLKNKSATAEELLTKVWDNNHDSPIKLKALENVLYRLKKKTMKINARPLIYYSKDTQQYSLFN